MIVNLNIISPRCSFALKFIVTKNHNYLYFQSIVGAGDPLAVHSRVALTPSFKSTSKTSKSDMNGGTEINMKIKISHSSLTVSVFTYYIDDTSSSSSVGMQYFVSFLA